MDRSGRVSADRRDLYLRAHRRRSRFQANMAAAGKAIPNRDGSLPRPRVGAVTPEQRGRFRTPLLMKTHSSGGRRRASHLVGLLLVVAAPACRSGAYTNVPLPGAPQQASLAGAPPALDRDHGRGEPRSLVILALTGGGSRAAYWSASVMLRLSQVFAASGLDIMSEVDAISCVSGGCLPAAYYAASADPGDHADPAQSWGKTASRPVWDTSAVQHLMSASYRSKWMWRWPIPHEFARYWLTAYDRTDLMGKVLAAELLTDTQSGQPLRFRDLNPKRPQLLINATNATAGSFGQTFTFTAGDFEKIHSDLSQYELARAVIASAAFPAVFNYTTLRDFAASDAASQRYVHLFDGGNVDNLGLETVIGIVERSADRFDRVIVILIDAYAPGRGVPPTAVDGRELFDFVLDLNFLESFETLLAKIRYSEIDRLSHLMQRLKDSEKKVTLLYHLKFDNAPLELTHKLNKIPTDFAIDREGTGAIDEAAAILMTPDNLCLGIIRRALTEAKVEGKELKLSLGSYPYCTWDAAGSRATMPESTS